MPVSVELTLFDAQKLLALLEMLDELDTALLPDVIEAIKDAIEQRTSGP